MSAERVRALVVTACQLLTDEPEEVEEGFIHRLHKADTTGGLASITPLSDMGVPHAMLLYERFLGRPFAGHRDSVSELVGDILETAIEELLTRHGITYRKTKRAERVEGFEQAQVVACIAGRGFKQRKQDMRKLIEATHGKVFTLQTLAQLVEHTQLKKFETKQVSKGP